MNSEESKGRGRKKVVPSNQRMQTIQLRMNQPTRTASQTDKKGILASVGADRVWDLATPAAAACEAFSRCKQRISSTLFLNFGQWSVC